MEAAGFILAVASTIELCVKYTYLYLNIMLSYRLTPPSDMATSSPKYIARTRTQK